MIREKIIFENKKLKVPPFPIIPYIEGDGAGQSIWKATKDVIDTAIEIAYGGERKIFWKQVYAGEKAFSKKGECLPIKTLENIKEHLVTLKGPLNTIIAGKTRSINLALIQELELFAHVIPIKFYKDSSFLAKNSELLDIVLFHENTERFMEANECFNALPNTSNFKKEINYSSPTNLVAGKAVSKLIAQRIIRAAIKYAIENNRHSVTIVNNTDNIEFSNVEFRDTAYQLAKAEFGAISYKFGSWMVIKKENYQIIIKDVQADIFLKEFILEPLQYDVILTPNSNENIISDALTQLVNGNSFTPSANINYETGVAIFEVRSATALRNTASEKENPSSQILSGVMMLEYMGWFEAANFILKGFEGAIAKNTLSSDLKRSTVRTTALKCSQFGKEIIYNM